MPSNPCAPEPSNPHKILVVKPSSLGDVVHSLPFLNSVKSRFPDAEIHWVIAKGLRELLDGHPMISRLWVIDKDQWKKPSRAVSTVKEIKALFAGLRRERFDIAVDLQGLLRSGIITMASRAKTRIGFKEAREGSAVFYTQKVAGGKHIHAVDRYLKIASAMGCDASNAEFPLIAHDFKAPFEGDYAVIAPGARWKTKMWPAERFGELAARLPIRAIIVGSKEDAPVSEGVAELSGGNAVSLAGKTALPELAGIIKGAKFMVSNDSGPMHIAAALGVQVFALFGPTDPRLTGPYGEGHKVIAAGAECSPCRKKQCNLNCMEAITVEAALQAINAAFGEAFRRPAF